MLDLFKKSIIYIFVVKFITFFSESYDKSFFKKFVVGFRKAYRSSTTFALIKKYADRKPLFESSVTYRGIKFIGRKLGKVADKLNGFINRIYDTSYLKSFIADTKKESTSEKIISIGLFFMITALSFLVFSVIFGQNYETRIYISWGLFFFGLITISAGKHVQVVKSSFTYKVIKYLVELVKM